MKIQYDNSTKRILNVGQEPWANQDDYPDSSIVEVSVAPLDPYYDYLYDEIEEQYDFSEWAEHPARLIVALDVEADTNIDSIVTEMKSMGLFTKSVGQIYAAIQTNIDAWSVPQPVKDDLRVWLPLMGASVVWIVRRLLRRT